MRVRELADWLGGPCEGDGEKGNWRRRLTLEAAGASQVAFVGNRKAAAAATESAPPAVCSFPVNPRGPDGDPTCDEPRDAFARAVSRLHPARVARARGGPHGRGDRRGCRNRRRRRHRRVCGDWGGLADRRWFGDWRGMHRWDRRSHLGSDCTSARQRDYLRRRGHRQPRHPPLRRGDRRRRFRLRAWPATARRSSRRSAAYRSATTWRSAPTPAWTGRRWASPGSARAPSWTTWCTLRTTAASAGTSWSRRRRAFPAAVVVEDYAVIGGKVGIGDKARIETRRGAGLGLWRAYVEDRALRPGGVGHARASAQGVPGATGQHGAPACTETPGGVAGEAVGSSRTPRERNGSDRKLSLPGAPLRAIHDAVGQFQQLLHSCQKSARFQQLGGDGHLEVICDGFNRAQRLPQIVSHFEQRLVPFRTRVDVVKKRSSLLWR